jgi:hypothetical protein
MREGDQGGIGTTTNKIGCEIEGKKKKLRNRAYKNHTEEKQFQKSLNQRRETSKNKSRLTER